MLEELQDPLVTELRERQEALSSRRHEELRAEERCAQLAEDQSCHV